MEKTYQLSRQVHPNVEDPSTLVWMGRICQDRECQHEGDARGTVVSAWQARKRGSLDGIIYKQPTEKYHANLRPYSSQHHPFHLQLRLPLRRVVWVSFGSVHLDGAFGELGWSGEASPTESRFSKHAVGKLETYQRVFMSTGKSGRKRPWTTELVCGKLEHNG